MRATTLTPENPIADINIYRVTTSSYKSVRLGWTYIGRIYYRKNNTRAVYTVTADSMFRLLKFLRTAMRKIASSDNITYYE